MSSPVKIVVIRPMLLLSQRREVGDVLTVDAADAASMIEAGRCALRDESDAPRIVAAVRAELQQQLREHGRQMQSPGSPWQPVAGGWH